MDWSERDIQQILEELCEDFLILNFNYESREMVSLDVRCKLNDSYDSDYKKFCSDWIKRFSKLTFTNWIVRYTYPNMKQLLYKKVYFCQHSRHKKCAKNYISGDDRCSANIIFRAKLINKNNIKYDEHLKKGLNVTINVLFKHSHFIEITEKLSYLPCDPEVELEFVRFFESGMSAAAAKKYHEMKIAAKYGETKSTYLANGQINPTENHVKYLYQIWKASKFSESSDKSPANSVKNEPLEPDDINFEEHTTEIMSPFTADMNNAENIISESETLGESFPNQYQSELSNLKTDSGVTSGVIEGTSDFTFNSIPKNTKDIKVRLVKISERKKQNNISHTKDRIQTYGRSILNGNLKASKMNSRVTSKAWLHFSPITPDRKVTCNYCGIVLSVKLKSTCTVIRHLKQKHSEILGRNKDTILTNRAPPTKVPSPISSILSDCDSQATHVSTSTIVDPTALNKQKSIAPTNHNCSSCSSIIAESEYDKIGKTWGNELKKMTPVQQIFAKRAFAEIIFAGQLGCLDHNSVQIFKDDRKNEADAFDEEIKYFIIPKSEPELQID